MVANFLKKYWLGLLLMTLFCIVTIFLTPAQEDLYFAKDFKEFENKVRIYTTILTGIILLLIVLKALKEKLSLTKMAIFIVNLLLLGIPIWIWLNTFGFYAALLINKINAKHESANKFIIEGINQKYSSIYITDLKNGELRNENSIIRNNNLDSVKVKDTITVSYKTGFFGYRYNPILEK